MLTEKTFYSTDFTILSIAIISLCPFPTGSSGLRAWALGIFVQEQHYWVFCHDISTLNLTEKSLKHILYILPIAVISMWPFPTGSCGLRAGALGASFSSSITVCKLFRSLNKLQGIKFLVIIVRHQNRLEPSHQTHVNSVLWSKIFHHHSVTSEWLPSNWLMLNCDLNHYLNNHNTKSMGCWQVWKKKHDPVTRMWRFFQRWWIQNTYVISFLEFYANISFCYQGVLSSKNGGPMNFMTNWPISGHAKTYRPYHKEQGISQGLLPVKLKPTCAALLVHMFKGMDIKYQIDTFFLHYKSCSNKSFTFICSLQPCLAP